MTATRKRFRYRSHGTSDPPHTSARVCVCKCVTQGAQYPSYLSAINVFLRFIVTLHASSSAYARLSAGKLFQFVLVSPISGCEFAWAINPTSGLFPCSYIRRKNLHFCGDGGGSGVRGYIRDISTGRLIYRAFSRFFPPARERTARVDHVALD